MIDISVKNYRRSSNKTDFYRLPEETISDLLAEFESPEKLVEEFKKWLEEEQLFYYGNEEIISNINDILDRSPLETAPLKESNEGYKPGFFESFDCFLIKKGYKFSWKIVYTPSEAITYLRTHTKVNTFILPNNILIELLGNSEVLGNYDSQKALGHAYIKWLEDQNLDYDEGKINRNLEKVINSTPILPTEKDKDEAMSFFNLFDMFLKREEEGELRFDWVNTKHAKAAKEACLLMADDDAYQTTLVNNIYWSDVDESNELRKYCELIQFEAGDNEAYEKELQKFFQSESRFLITVDIASASIRGSKVSSGEFLCKLIEHDKTVIFS